MSIIGQLSCRLFYASLLDYFCSVLPQANHETFHFLSPSDPRQMVLILKVCFCSPPRDDSLCVPHLIVLTVQISILQTACLPSVYYHLLIVNLLGHCSPILTSTTTVALNWFNLARLLSTLSVASIMCLVSGLSAAGKNVLSLPL